MQPQSRQTLSAWMATADTGERPKLLTDASADVCVVGAGIAGLSVAYGLASEGKSVIVLDDGPIGGGESGRTTAHLTSAIDEGYAHMERLHGEEGARLVADSHSAAIEAIQRAVREEGIDCGFRRVYGYLVLNGEQGDDVLRNELEAIRKTGLPGVRLLQRLPVDFHDFGPCLVYPQQGQFHVLRYLEGLAKAIERKGGKIHLNNHVGKIEGGSPARVSVDGGPVVRCGAVVVATNAPVNDGFPIYTKQAPYRTYVIGARIPRDSVPAFLLWDTGDPYHYVRTFSPDGEDHDVLIAGGEDHKTGQEDDGAERFKRLEAWTRKRFPMVERTLYRWSGQVLEPGDGPAMIGRNPMDADNVFVVTGDSGNGMTHGTIAGLLLTDLILGRDNPWKDLYSPSRFPKAPVEFAKEGANVAKQYLDVVTGGEKEEEKHRIPLDSGVVVRRGLKQVAVYRDPEGNIREMSAVCPHKGCIVKWNSTEKSWDCPCHGSRFACDGTVLNGPSISDLKPAD